MKWIMASKDYFFLEIFAKGIIRWISLPVKIIYLSIHVTKPSQIMKPSFLTCYTMIGYSHMFILGYSFIEDNTSFSLSHP
jgi:hypothetical protein